MQVAILSISIICLYPLSALTVVYFYITFYYENRRAHQQEIGCESSLDVRTVRSQRFDSLEK